MRTTLSSLPVCRSASLPSSAPFTNDARLEATPSSMNHARRTLSHQCCTWQLPRSQTWHTHRGDCTEPQPRGTHVTRELGSIWQLGSVPREETGQGC